jgi:hypothetical protein
MPHLSTSQRSKVVSNIKKLYTRIQAVCTFFEKLYDRNIHRFFCGEILLEKSPLFWQNNGLQEPKIEPKTIKTALLQ